MEHGFAYGENGNKLKGKKIIFVISTFGPEEAYRQDGYNNYTMEELLSPLHQTANLCQLEWVKPIVLHGVAKRTDAEILTFRDLVATEIEKIRT